MTDDKKDRDPDSNHTKGFARQEPKQELPKAELKQGLPMDKDGNVRTTNPAAETKDGKAESRTTDENLTEEEKAEIEAENERINTMREVEPHKKLEPDNEEKHPKPAEEIKEDEIRETHAVEPGVHHEIPPEVREGEDLIPPETDAEKAKRLQDEDERRTPRADRSDDFEVREKVVAYWCQQFSKLNLGKYQFIDNRMEIPIEEQKDFEKLLESQPPQIRNAVKLIDPDAAERFARRINKPQMRQGVDTTASTRTGTPNPAPGRN